MTECNKPVARTPQLGPDPTARICGTCVYWRVIPGEGEIFGECARDDAREAVGQEFCPRCDFGCRFHEPDDVTAYRAALLDAGAQALHLAMTPAAGSHRNALPAEVAKLGTGARERLYIAASRLATVWGLLP